MTELFAPVRTLADLDSLDSDEMVAGYHEGRANEPKPGANRRRAAWHGWRNGMMDAGHMPIDDATRELAKAFLARERGKHR